MIDQLFKLVQQESQNDIIDNPAIPNEQNNQAVGLAAESIFGGLQGALANGGLRDVLGMFGDKANVNAENPVVNGISGDFVGSLIKKLGIDAGTASSIAGALIPGIIGKLVNKTNDPNDSSFNINDIIGSLTGGQTNGSGVQLPGANEGSGTGGIDFGGILKNLSSGSLDANGDGKLSVDDLSGLLSGAASKQQTQNQTGGGITDLLKGFLNN